MTINPIISTKLKDDKIAEYTAKELFEDIGFALVVTDDHYVYTKPHARYKHIVSFDLNTKTYNATKDENGVITPYPIRTEVLKAIVKQERELNWL